MHAGRAPGNYFPNVVGWVPTLDMAKFQEMCWSILNSMWSGMQSAYSTIQWLVCNIIRLGLQTPVIGNAILLLLCLLKMHVCNKILEGRSFPNPGFPRNPSLAPLTLLFTVCSFIRVVSCGRLWSRA